MTKAIRFLHAAAGFPVKATWIDTIQRGNYATWPTLSAEAVERHYPESDATTKGHLKKQRQNVRSTKIKIENVQDEALTATEPGQPHGVYLKVFNAHNTVYTDQTGRMPVISNRGNKLIMVMFENDSNFIDAEPMRDSTDASLIAAYKTLWKRLTYSGKVTPTMHILDNEASDAFKQEISKNCKYQLVPPDTHRRNLAERAIQTFKSHFIAILSGLDESFPMPLWDCLLPQAIITLNLLRQASADPTVSAYEFVHGRFDYNAMPLAPLGCAVQVHEHPQK